MFKAFEADLPVQMGQTIELRDYQQEAIENLKRCGTMGKTIALLYHATGVGKTITAATDAKAVGGRTLFLVNALKLASQAKDTFAGCGRRRHLASIPVDRKMFHIPLFLQLSRAFPKIWKSFFAHSV